MTEWQHPTLSVEEDLRSRLRCIAEATSWDRPYDMRLEHIRGLCDLTQAGDRPISVCQHCLHPTAEHRVLLTSSGWAHCEHRDCLCALKPSGEPAEPVTEDPVDRPITCGSIHGTGHTCGLPLGHAGNMHSTQPDVDGWGWAWVVDGVDINIGLSRYRVTGPELSRG